MEKKAPCMYRLFQSNKNRDSSSQHLYHQINGSLSLPLQKSLLLPLKVSLNIVSNF